MWETEEIEEMNILSVLIRIKRRERKNENEVATKEGK
jgi:hypothetical protein